MIPLPHLLLLLLLLIFSGCREQQEATPVGLTEVILQTDWFPQPEHGGFYQALAKGYYAEEGLQVTLLPGGPNAMSTQKVLKGSAHFAMNRADTILMLAAREVPALMVMATLQHDPQALLLHAADPVKTFEDLDGRRVMAVPGLNWIRWLEARYGIEMDIIPHDFGLQRFMQDPEFIQQCLLTNEPFYVRQEGVEARTLPLRESGFDPYHGIYCLRDWAAEHPETVAAFVRASVRGWRDFILNDPSPALALIAERNPKMTPDFMAFSYRALREHKLVTGQEAGGESVGALSPDRMNTLVTELVKIGLLSETDLPSEPWFTTQFLEP